MKNLFTVLACVFLAVLIMPAFIEPPVHENALHDAVALEGAKLLEAIKTYHEEFGEFPPGDAVEIIRELRGENAKRQVFFECPTDALNSTGELLDPWGTPYRFSFETDSETPKIQSAGPNRIFEEEHVKHSDDYRSWHHKH